MNPTSELKNIIAATAGTDMADAYGRLSQPQQVAMVACVANKAGDARMAHAALDELMRLYEDR